MEIMNDMFEVTKIYDTADGGIRKASFLTCGIVCSQQIDIELDGDIIRKVQYTGIDCKGRGTSCPDQLARALKML